jgi:hypothetical protein
MFHNLQQNNLIPVSHAGIMCGIEKKTCGNETTRFKMQRSLCGIVVPTGDSLAKSSQNCITLNRITPLFNELVASMLCEHA